MQNVPSKGTFSLQFSPLYYSSTITCTAEDLWKAFRYHHGTEEVPSEWGEPLTPAQKAWAPGAALMKDRVRKRP